MKSNVRTLDALEEELGLQFSDRSLLQQAFVHRSYLNEAAEETDLLDNQRLEFLGDAALNFIVGDMLFRRYPESREGELTKLRAAMVKGDTLAQFGNELGLGNYLLLGRGEEANGGRTRPAIISDAYEALIGAIYLDQGISVLRGFLESRLKAEMTRLTRDAHSKDPKSQLQELVQAKSGATPHYETVHTEGPAHARLFTCQVMVDGLRYGVGRGQSKQEAEKSAAKMALFRLGQPAAGHEDSGLARQYELAPVDTLKPAVYGPY